MRVLVAEDDPMIGRAVMSGLKGAGYAVDWVRDGVAAQHALEGDEYDLLLLDLGLPRRHGLDILRTVRRTNNDLPILIIPARDAIGDRVAGLDCGADDYLVKPFNLDELLARARVVLRRHMGRRSTQITYGALSLDPSRRSVEFRGAAID